MKPLLLALILSATAQAASVGGIDVPDQRDGLPLSGAGLLRKGFFFKVYVGALYMERGALPGSGPMRLDIHYFHHTPKKYMVRAAEHSLRKNLSEDEYRKLLPRIGALHEAYRDGEPGTCASLVFTPGKGLVYSFDGQAVATIPGDVFATAYFKVWLGENPSSQSMKDALLGCRK